MVCDNGRLALGGLKLLCGNTRAPWLKYELTKYDQKTRKI